MLIDDAKTIARLDSGNVRASISALPDQIASAWRDARKVFVPASYKNADQVVVAGMGGSSLPAHIINSVYGRALRVPFSFFNGYELPGSVGKHSVIIVSSYSGTTEETIACFKAAKSRQAKIIGITSGGPLAKMLRREKAPAYIFDPVHNPCRQPRLGIGYTAAGLLGLLDSMKVIGASTNDVANIPDELRSLSAPWSPNISSNDNPAKLMAHALAGTVPVIISAEHLIGNGHAFQNEIHECAKQFSVAFPVPELNHHLMEGLTNPAELRRLLAFLFIDSDLYAERISRRLKVTQKVLAKQGYGFNLWKASHASPLGQAFETLAFGSWVSFYMAIQNRIDPSNIPWVDFFKKELGRG
jgi:glucose/mannose-6-phosphate isomerase